MRLKIKIDPGCRQEALRYLGCKGEINDERLLRQLDAAQRAAQELPDAAVLAERFLIEDGGKLTGTAFSAEGCAASALLDGCREAILFATSLGMQSERRLMRTQATSPADALVLDAVLSAAIERVCDAACEEIEKTLKADGLAMTRRFSPGYGDMPLNQTAEIIEVLAADKLIGLTVSKQGLMIPRKSVTAIIGIKEGALTEQKRSACAECSMKSTCRMKRTER